MTRSSVLVKRVPTPADAERHDPNPHPKSEIERRRECLRPARLRHTSRHSKPREEFQRADTSRACDREGPPFGHTRALRTHDGHPQSNYDGRTFSEQTICARDSRTLGDGRTLGARSGLLRDGGPLHDGGYGSSHFRYDRGSDENSRNAFKVVDPERGRSVQSRLLESDILSSATEAFDPDDLSNGSSFYGLMRKESRPSELSVVKRSRRSMSKTRVLPENIIATASSPGALLDHPAAANAVVCMDECTAKIVQRSRPMTPSHKVGSSVFYAPSDRGSVTAYRQEGSSVGGLDSSTETDALINTTTSEDFLECRDQAAIEVSISNSRDSESEELQEDELWNTQCGRIRTAGPRGTPFDSAASHYHSAAQTPTIPSTITPKRKPFGAPESVKRPVTAERRPVAALQPVKPTRDVRPSTHAERIHLSRAAVNGSPKPRLSEAPSRIPRRPMPDAGADTIPQKLVDTGRGSSFSRPLQPVRSSSMNRPTSIRATAKASSSRGPAAREVNLPQLPQRQKIETRGGPQVMGRAASSTLPHQTPPAYLSNRSESNVGIFRGSSGDTSLYSRQSSGIRQSTSQGTGLLRRLAEHATRVSPFTPVRPQLVQSPAHCQSPFKRVLEPPGELQCTLPRSERRGSCTDDRSQLKMVDSGRNFGRDSAPDMSRLRVLQEESVGFFGSAPEVSASIGPRKRLESVAFWD